MALLPLSWYPSHVTAKIQLIGRAMIMLQTFMRATRKPIDGSVIHSSELAPQEGKAFSAGRTPANETMEAASTTSGIREPLRGMASSNTDASEGKGREQIYSMASDASSGGSLRADEALIDRLKQGIMMDVDQGRPRAPSEGNDGFRKQGRRARLQLRQRRTQNA